MNTALRKKRATLRATDLHIHTIRELEHKRDNAYDSEQLCLDHNDEESAIEWGSTIAAIRAVLSTPTIKTLSLHPLAQAELDNSITSDMSNDERRMILRDLCRAGWFPEKAPPGTVWLGTPPATIQVDGKQYEVGSYD